MKAACHYKGIPFGDKLNQQFFGKKGFPCTHFVHET